MGTRGGDEVPTCFCGKPCERRKDRNSYREHCAGHRKQIKRHGRVVSETIQERGKDPIEGSLIATLKYQDELDTLTQADWEKARERLRKSWYRRLYRTITGLPNPRVVQRESLPNGLVRITFQEVPRKRATSQHNQGAAR